MADTSGSGDTPPTGWVELEAPARVEDPATREAFVELGERMREGYALRMRDAREFEKFRFVLFGDIATLLKGQARIESLADVNNATVKVLAAKVAAADRGFEQLARETGSARVSLTELERRQVVAERRLAENTSKYAVDKVRFDERLTWIDRRTSKVETDVGDTSKRAAVSEELAREALSSAHEVVDEKKEAREEQREIRKERREFKWKAWHAILGLSCAVLLIVAGAVVQAHYGPQNIHLPPAGPAGQEHHP
jgi:hypothetical protein